MTENLIAQLKREIDHVQSSLKIPLDYDTEIANLQKENAELKLEVNEWKNKLIAAESRNGIQQVPVQVASKKTSSQPEVAVKEVTKKPAAPVAEVKEAKAGKKGKGKKEVEKKPAQPEDAAVDVGR